MDIRVTHTLPDGDVRECTVRARAGQTILEALRAAHVAIQSPCGGAGVCGKCRVAVKLPNGAQSEVIACQTKVADAMEVELGRTDGALCVESGAKGVLDAVGRFPLDPASEGELGIGFDLGTTTIAAYLLDLCTGELVVQDGRANPQGSFGADVVSRIHACQEGSLDALQQAAACGLRELVEGLCSKAGASSSRITRWAVAGNTVMQHILCGLSPEGIGVYPFEPQTRFGARYPIAGCTDAGGRASATGSTDAIGRTDVASDADTAYLCPCVSGYVGGDVVAGIVACGLDRYLACSEKPVAAARTVLFADLGTNGEMALIHDGLLTCCATATGPAFEGATISQGMQARSGAIDSCYFDGHVLACTTIDDAPAVGICGSGLIDVLAACLKAGVVDETGRILLPDELPAACKDLVELRGGKPVVRLGDDGSVVLTQRDVRALQLAKAAVAAGVACLLGAANVGVSDIDEFVIGGAFGAHMRTSSAAEIGLFPKELASRVRMVGNCAGAGACAAVLSGEARARMSAVAAHARYVELSLDPDFSEAYVEAMEFSKVADE